MTIISMEAKIAELETQLAESKKQLALMKEKYINGDPVGRWIPKHGERYYAICADGDITSYTFEGDLDIKMYNMGNCFKTLVEAEYMEERLKLIAELHQWSESKDRYWGDIECTHYYLTYDYMANRIDIEEASFVTLGVIYFGSREAAEQALKTIGEERLKKYYFGVRRG